MMLRIITVLILILVHETRSESSESGAKPTIACQIFNEFHRVYMYAHFKFFGLGKYRRVRLENVFKGSMNYSDYDSAGVWFFEPLDSTATKSGKSFLIRNKKYPNEYLRGSNFYQEWFYKTNRAAVLQEMTNRTSSSYDENMFEWSVRQVGNNRSSQHFYIYNTKLDVPLYARNYDSIWKPQYYKMVGLLNMLPDVNTEQFEWVFKCRDNKHPILENF